MSGQDSYSDQDLTAFLDGELEPKKAAELEAALRNDVDLAARLDDLRLDTSQIARSFDDLLASAPDAPDFLNDDAVKPSVFQIVPMRSIAATAMVGLLIGAVTGFLIGDKKDETWREYVATYQALYVNTTLAHIDLPEATASAELERVSGILGKSIELAALKDQDGLDYKRAQILGFEGRPLLQMTFLSKVGAPIALCVMRSADNDAETMHMDTMQGMRSASWSKNGYDYLLIGGTDAELIKRSAAKFASRL